ncbi:MAG: hypothetical protein AB7N65_19510 [Vicinamibacterales bacterium]
MTLRLVVTLWLVASSHGALTAQVAVGDPALQVRLADDRPLTADELGRLVAASAAAIDGRPVRASDGPSSALVDATGREVLFLVLSGLVPVKDAGVRRSGTATLRGLSAVATPPRSEIGARQTLWIDIATQLPKRFEFAYELAGLGDVAYDLEFDRPTTR